MQREGLRVAINGLGRIGRMIFRQGFDSLNIVAVNGTSPAQNLAHFLKYDSVHGIWKKPISWTDKDLIVENQKIICFQERDPYMVPWDKHSIDIVIECSGKFKTKKHWKTAFAKGVKKVIVSAPAEDPDFTLLYGVNQNFYQESRHSFVSLASCTTNCLAPLIHVLKKCCGIKKLFFSTIHSYTNDQRLLDSSHKDLRRARAGGLNIIPTSTGAGQALALIFPELRGCVQGMAFRVPTANVSLLDLTVETEKESYLVEIHQALRRASQRDLKGILAIVEEPLVSSDFIGRRESAIVDFPLSCMQGGKLLKLVAWYDNEAGFSQRMIDFVSSL